MEGTEKISNIHEHEVCDENAKNTYEIEEHENVVSQGELHQGELSADISEVTYESTTTQGFEEELNAVDLRVIRSASGVDPSKEVAEIYDRNKNTSSTANFLNSFNRNDSVTISFETQTETVVKNLNYPSPNTELNCGSSENTAYGFCPTFQQNSYQNIFSLKEKNQNHFNGEKHFVLLVDQETQTQIKESKEACVQTESYNRNFSLPFIKRKSLSSFHYYCLACQRFYSSKSSFDRHTRSHVRKRVNGKLTHNFMGCSKEKCKIVGNCSESQLSLSTPLQVAKFKCEICCKRFSNQLAKNDHLKSFVLEEFPLTKCKECHIKFFTVGALNDHMNSVHERNIYNCKSYCCIFCNESFECSFSFQLHLEDHLTT